MRRSSAASNRRRVAPIAENGAMMMTQQQQIEIVNRAAFSVGEAHDYDRLLKAIGEAHLVLIGEAVISSANATGRSFITALPSLRSD